MLSPCNVVKRYSLVNVIIRVKYRNTVSLNDFFFDGKLTIWRLFISYHEKAFSDVLSGMASKSFPGASPQPLFCSQLKSRQINKILNRCAVLVCVLG